MGMGADVAIALLRRNLCGNGLATTTSLALSRPTKSNLQKRSPGACGNSAVPPAYGSGSISTATSYTGADSVGWKEGVWWLPSAGRNTQAHSVSMCTGHATHPPPSPTATWSNFRSVSRKIVVAIESGLWDFSGLIQHDDAVCSALKIVKDSGEGAGVWPDNPHTYFSRVGEDREPDSFDAFIQDAEDTHDSVDVEKRLSQPGSAADGRGAEGLATDAFEGTCQCHTVVTVAPVFGGDNKAASAPTAGLDSRPRLVADALQKPWYARACGGVQWDHR